MPGSFDEDTTVIQDSAKEKQSIRERPESREEALSLHEQLQLALDEAARLKDYAKACKYRQGQYAHRVIQAQEELGLYAAKKQELEERVAELERELEQANMRHLILPEDQTAAALQQENAQLRAENENLQEVIKSLQQKLRESILVRQPARTGNDTQAELNKLRDELRNELREEINILMRGQREATATTGATNATGLSEAALLSYRPRAEGPKEPIDGTNVEEYHSWRYAVDHKIEEDALYYNNDKRKVAYALKNMKPPLFTSMQNWVTDNAVVTYQGFMEEVENWMGVHLEYREAKKELRKINQKQGEKISTYFHRIHSLWVRAKIPEDERVEQFLTTALPYLTTGLLADDYTSVRDLFEKIRRIETRKIDQQTYHPRTPTGRATTMTTPANRSNTGGKSTTPALTSDIKKQSLATPGNNQTEVPRPNEKFGPVAKKPDGWKGAWYDSETNPKKLTTEDKALLQRQGRCWSCRGSGHRSADSCCPFNQNKKLLNNLEVEGDSDSDKSEK